MPADLLQDIAGDDPAEIGHEERRERHDAIDDDGPHRIRSVLDHQRRSNDQVEEQHEDDPTQGFEREADRHERPD